MAVNGERLELLRHIDSATDKPMIALAVIWIGLTIKGFFGTLSHPLLILNSVIWAAFIVDFVLKLLVAPHKHIYLKKNWLAAISLLLPAFRILRIFQALGSLQAVSVLRLLTSTNRAMGALRTLLGRSGAGYVVATTLLVLFVGAAGMYAFENPRALAAAGFGKVADQGGGIVSYVDGLWWTFMLMTTIGSAYWPVTDGGRIVCVVLSFYSLGVFGYLTALIASLLIDNASAPPAAAVENAELAALKTEIAALREALTSTK